MVMQRVQVLRFASEDLQTTEFATFTGDADTMFRRDERTVEVERLDLHPQQVRTQPQGAQIVLTVRVNDGQVAYEVQEEIMRIFRPGRTGTLVFNMASVEEGESGDDIRTVEATVVATSPVAGNGTLFEVSLRTADPRLAGPTKVVNGASAIAASVPLTTDTVRNTGTEGDGLPFPMGITGVFRGTTNLITNGGFESNTTGWSKTGTNVLSRVSDTDKVCFGEYAAQVEVNGSIFILSRALTFPGAGRYVVSAKVRALDWDGGDLGVSLTGFASSSVVTAGNADFSDSTREFLEVYQVVDIDASGLSGFVLVSTSSLPTAGRLVQIDGVQAEAGDFPTPYVETDGSTATRAAGYVPVDVATFDETQGWFAVKLWPGFTGDETTTDRNVMFWGNATDHLRLYYDATANQYKFTRMASSSSTTVAVVSVPNYRDNTEFLSIFCEWNATTIGIVAGGSSAMTTAANTHIPDLSAEATWYIGNDDVNSEYFDGWIVNCEYGTGQTTSSYRSAFAAAPTFDNLLVDTTNLTRSAWRARGLTVTQTSIESDGGRRYHRITWGGSVTDRILQVVRNPDRPFTYYTPSPSTVVRAAFEARGEYNGQQFKLRISDDNGEGTDDTEAIITLTTTDQVYEVTHTVGDGGSGFLAVSIEPVGASTEAFLVAEPSLVEVTEDSEGFPSSKPKVPPPKLGPGLGTPPTGPNFGNLGLGSRTKIDPNVTPGPGGGGPGPGADTFQVSVPQNGTAFTNNAAIVFRPDQNKSTSNFWNIANDVLVVNRAPEPLIDWPVRIIESSFNHAARVSGGQSLASGQDIRVMVDGVFVPWFPSSASDLNTANLEIWINIDLQARKTATLRNSITAGAPAQEEKLYVSRGQTASWPENGVILLNDEVIFYEGKGVDYFLVSGRGGRNTTAASHTAGDTLYWVEKKIYFLYSGASTLADSYFEEPRRAPMIDLEQSTNTSHVWTSTKGYFHDTDPRSRQWVRGLDLDADSQSGRITVPGGEPATDLKFVYKRDGAEPGFPNYNLLRLACPVGTAVRDASNAVAMTCTCTGNGQVGAVVNGVSDDGQRTFLGVMHQREATSEDADIIKSESFESDDGDYIENSNNTAVVSNEARFDGLQSLKLTYNGTSTTLGGWAGITLNGATPHTISLWVSRAAFTTGTLTMTASFTSATVTTSVPGESATNVADSERDHWIRIAVYVTPNASFLTGTITLTASGSPTSGDVWYIDGFQVEEQQRQRPFYNTERAVPAREEPVRSIELYGRSLVVAAPPRVTDFYNEALYEGSAFLTEYPFTSPSQPGSIMGVLLYMMGYDLQGETYAEKVRFELGYYDGQSPAQFVELNRDTDIISRIIGPAAEEAYVFFPDRGTNFDTQQELFPGQPYVVRWTGGENTENAGPTFPEYTIREFPVPPNNDDEDVPDCRVLSWNLDPLPEARANEDSFIEFDTITVKYNEDEVPYVARITANAIKYVMDFTIFNQATGQTIEIFGVLPSATGSNVAIDVATRTITSINSPEPNKSLLAGTTVSDPVRWIDIVPGVNDFVATDTEGVNFKVQFFYSDRYV